MATQFVLAPQSPHFAVEILRRWYFPVLTRPSPRFHQTSKNTGLPAPVQYFFLDRRASSVYNAAILKVSQTVDFVVLRAAVSTTVREEKSGRQMVANPLVRKVL